MNPLTRKKFEEMLHLEKMEGNEQVTPYLAYLTGYKYSIAAGSMRIWGDENAEIHAKISEYGYEHEEEETLVDPVEYGEFYQIMPVGEDDGFFDWYCDNRTNYQFFQNIETAVLHFSFWWNVWKKEKISNN